MLFTCVLTTFSNRIRERGSPLYGFIVHLAARLPLTMKSGEIRPRAVPPLSLSHSPPKIGSLLYKSEKDHNGSSIKGAIILSQLETV